VQCLILNEANLLIHMHWGNHVTDGLPSANIGIGGCASS
jgi:hypothetical protein